MSSPEDLVSFRRTASGLNRRSLRNFARVLSEKVAGREDFHCLITDDCELRRLNSRFLGRDYATDVLSFPSGDDSLGEIVISAERAAAQAREYGHSADAEVELLMLHGLLHLLGMDHETDHGRMRRLEAAWRLKLGLPVGVIERVRA